jgi:hypothetical protein
MRKIGPGVKILAGRGDGSVPVAPAVCATRPVLCPVVFGHLKRAQNPLHGLRQFQRVFVLFYINPVFPVDTDMTIVDPALDIGNNSERSQPRSSIAERPTTHHT